uniref:FkbM family methyltransferase n=1 Tax=Ignisphaera aggregans TaxID=334771 RepID=A0A7J2U052_9CREN
MPMTRERILAITRSRLLKMLAKALPYIYLQLDKNLCVYFPSDGFGALEENLLTGHNIYFDIPSITEADTIIDLGAHAGSFTIYAILHSKPGARIIAVEPSNNNFTFLLANLKLFENVIKEKRLEILALKKAVWSYRGILKFIDIGWSEGGYVTPSQSVHSKAYVEAITLDEILNLSKGKILIKMDIEGAEVEVLNSSKELNRVHALAIEAHGNEQALIKILNKHGFKTKIVIYKLNPQLYRYWLKIKPKPYGILVALYRFLVSSIITPTITLIKAVNAKQE